MTYLENKIPPPLVTLMFGALMWGVSILTPIAGMGSVVQYSAVGLVGLVGVLFAVSGIVSFHIAKTTVNPLKPQMATSLVTSGIYRVTRNPMYTGLALILCGWGVWLGSIWSLGGVVLYMLYIHRFQIYPEEKALMVLFGHEFTHYKSRVRPWL
jgi:protein-S-isoprenylcysteine O-methyltransferase Ste14